MNAVSTLDQVLAAAMDRLPWPAVVVEESGTVVYLNEAMKGRGYTPETAAGKSLWDLLPEYYTVLHGTVPWLTEQEAEVTRQNPQGKVHERVWVRRLPRGACLIITDRTRLWELELGHAQTARLASLGFLLAGVCHEVSNPLAAVYSMVQILQSSEGIAPEMLEKGLANIAANVKRILDISRRLSDFSRVGEEGKAPVRVDWAIEEALVLVRQNRAFGAIEVVHEPDSMALVMGHLGQLRQVFLNILTNAVQAMQGRGRLAIVTRRPEPAWVEVEVRDTGPGIAAEHLPRVFEPFFSTKPAGEGVGLGLVISSEIVHEHGGTIQAENHPEGGACFRVRLPFHERQP